MFIGVYNLYFKKEGESLLGRYGQSSSRYKPQAWQSTDRAPLVTWRPLRAA